MKTYLCPIKPVSTPLMYIRFPAATAPKRRKEFDVPVDFKKSPEMRRMVLACSSIFEAARGEALEALQSRPVSFTAVALAEVLARWQRRGIPCAETRNPCTPPEDVARNMTHRYATLKFPSQVSGTQSPTDSIRLVPPQQSLLGK